MNIAHTIRRELFAAWRRRWRLWVLLAILSLLLTTFVGPMLRHTQSTQYTVDLGAHRERDLFRTSYGTVLEGSTAPSVLTDPDAVMRSLASLRYDDPRVLNNARMPIGAAQFLVWTHEEWGFPFRCVRGWQAKDYRNVNTLGSEGVIEIPSVLRPSVYSPTLVPGIPVPLAIAFNFAFFFAAWATLVLFLGTPAAWRKSRRVRAGHCPRCGYDLRGDLVSGCPECGWGRNFEKSA